MMMLIEYHYNFPWDYSNNEWSFCKKENTKNKYDLLIK